MAEALIFDTDVLIDYLRSRSEAVTFLEGTDGPLFTSVITVAELYAGVREGAERVALLTFLRAFSILPLDEESLLKVGYSGGIMAVVTGSD